MTERGIRAPRPWNTRLYHSNLNIPKSLTQYDFISSSKKSSSMDALHRVKTTFPAQRQRRERHRKEVIKRDEGDRLPLILPKLEPDIDIDLDVTVRDASAKVNEVSMSDKSEDERMSYDEETANDADSEASDDYFNFDDDTATARSKLEKIGEFEMEHNWLLHEDLQRKRDEFNSQSKKLRVSLPEEDPVEMMENRMDEVRSMMRPKAELGHFLDKIDPEQREKIMRLDHQQKIAKMDGGAIKKQRFKRGMRAIEKFKHAVELVLILARACISRRKYYKEVKPETALAVKRLRQKGQREDKDTSRSSLAFDMQLAFSTEPNYRSKSDIKKIIWVLRATKAFKQLFPVEVEADVARCVAYERYDSNRILALQERDPERFYYIMSGKVQKVQEYRLSSGLVTRSEGYIEKGTTTDAQELEMAWQREHHLVSRGQVEVLIIHRDDFLRLRNRTLGPPIDFLRKLDLFLEFPCDVFKTNPDSIHLKYYGQDVTIVEDTNRTPWIHIVKSGRVRVVRIQSVIDVETDRKFMSQSTEELGCGRSFSHAQAMIGSLMSQRKMKALSGSNISLPEIHTTEVSNPFVSSMGIGSSCSNSFSRKNSNFAEGIGILSNVRGHKITKRRKPSVTTPPLHSPMEQDETKTGNLAVEATERQRSNKRKAKYVKPPIVVEQGVDNPSSGRGSRADITPDTELPDILITNGQDTPAKKNDKRTSFPPIMNSTERPHTNGELHPHGTYLTREMTEFDPVYARKATKEIKLRPAYLQLDVLNPGDIFGLDAISKKFHSQLRRPGEQGLEHLQPPTASESKGVILVSDGAEVIEISKRFFLEHAQNNTMLRVETMQREYMNNDEAKDILYTKETWDQYKNVLMRRLVRNVTKPQRKS
ncbi:uncharacterized protein LOC110464811 isoform X2 [Mizuhopecten yessoensis]|uniref:uncharacterized protein LOC110464811 isoform X2 n=1 Tax=Mizuhopecten yessoensis TaxID=6573 RepID=UPI000B45D700|nr:uncharacterized protein LOC110464811 isoform X2 [Mizuhopecten yessoensis]